MGLMIGNLSVPIGNDEHGVARVGGTRVTLQTVVGEFLNGSTPEQITQDFDCLQLGDIYCVIAYYLLHRQAVDAYLQEQKRLGDETQRQMEALFPPQGIRERLLARRKETA